MSLWRRSNTKRRAGGRNSPGVKGTRRVTSFFPTYQFGINFRIPHCSNGQLNISQGNPCRNPCHHHVRPPLGVRGRERTEGCFQRREVCCDIPPEESIQHATFLFVFKEILKPPLCTNHSIVCGGFQPSKGTDNICMERIRVGIHHCDTISVQNKHVCEGP